MKLLLAKLHRRLFSKTKKYRARAVYILHRRINSLRINIEGLGLAVCTVYDIPKDEDYIEEIFRSRQRKLKAVKKLIALKRSYE